MLSDLLLNTMGDLRKQCLINEIDQNLKDIYLPYLRQVIVAANIFFFLLKTIVSCNSGKSKMGKHV